MILSYDVGVRENEFAFAAIPENNFQLLAHALQLQEGLLRNSAWQLEQ
jgi:hypothetical protein